MLKKFGCRDFRSDIFPLAIPDLDPSAKIMADSPNSELVFLPIGFPALDRQIYLINEPASVVIKERLDTAAGGFFAP